MTQPDPFADVRSGPDPFASIRSGRLGPAISPPAFAPASDASRLLAAVAEALNACERHGLAVDLEHGAALTTQGYVLPVGDSRLGSRWAVRSRLDIGTEDQQRHSGLRAPEEAQ